jgi:hypothetical protein
MLRCHVAAPPDLNRLCCCSHMRRASRSSFLRTKYTLRRATTKARRNEASAQRTPNLVIAMINATQDDCLTNHPNEGVRRIAPDNPWPIRRTEPEPSARNRAPAKDRVAENAESCQENEGYRCVPLHVGSCSTTHR